MDDTIEALERLAKLRDGGVLTQAEFDAQKARLLAGSGSGGDAAAASGVCPGCGAPLQLDPFGRCAYCGHVSLPGGAPAAFGGAPTSQEALADAIFRAVPDNKIMAIKQLREKTGLGLKEAKDLMDDAERRARGR
jgi:hypothetical protein